MAYSIGKTSALQTAIKAAVDIALAEYNAGDLKGSVMDRVHELADELKVELFAQVDEDQAQVSTSAPARTGFGRGSGNNGGPISVADAKSLVLNFGAFKGMTIGDVMVMTKDEASAYTSGKYNRSGLDYIKWMAANKDPKGAFATARAKVALDDFNAQTRDLAALAG